MLHVCLVNALIASCTVHYMQTLMSVPWALAAAVQMENVWTPSAVTLAFAIQAILGMGQSVSVSDV